MAVRADQKQRTALIRNGLKTFFGYENFLSADQELVTRQILEGRGDRFINLEPGAGKSICFMLPTVMKAHKVTVVFVPTHLLANDQILFLEQNKINVWYLSTRTSKKQVMAMQQNIQSKESDGKEYQFLYVLIDNRRLNSAKDIITGLKCANKLSYIIFDEAHCASPLSHHFVPAYQNVAKLVKKVCPNICKVALTATATTEVRQDLTRELDMKTVIKFRSTQYNRTVFYDVHFIDTIAKPLEHLVEFIEKALSEEKNEHWEVHRRCGVIFCRKPDVKRVAQCLVSANVDAVPYHGDFSLEVRKSIHERWTKGEISVIVATQQFGVGLHKPNLRFVVHWNLPLSFQQLYQESGRISADGRKGYARVYYSYGDEEFITTYIKSLCTKPVGGVDMVAQKLRFFDGVINYCLQIRCRHVVRWSYFSRTVPPCEKHCDVCQDARGVQSRVTEFLKYRASMRKAIADKLELAKGESGIISVRLMITGTLHTREKATTPPKCNRKLRLLFRDLKCNYLKTRKQIKRRMTKSDVAAIAYRLEQSFKTGAHSHPKSNHELYQTILGIRSATKSGVACGYLKYLETEEKPIFKLPSNVDVDIIEID